MAKQHGIKVERAQHVPDFISAVEVRLAPTSMVEGGYFSGSRYNWSKNMRAMRLELFKGLVDRFLAGKDAFDIDKQEVQRLARKHGFDEEVSVAIQSEYHYLKWISGRGVWRISVREPILTAARQDGDRPDWQYLDEKTMKSLHQEFQAASTLDQFKTRCESLVMYRRQTEELEVKYYEQHEKSVNNAVFPDAVRKQLVQAIADAGRGHGRRRRKMPPSIQVSQSARDPGLPWPLLNVGTPAPPTPGGNVSRAAEPRTPLPSRRFHPT